MVDDNLLNLDCKRIINNVVGEGDLERINDLRYRSFAVLDPLDFERGYFRGDEEGASFSYYVGLFLRGKVDEISNLNEDEKWASAFLYNDFVEFCGKKKIRGVSTRVDLECLFISKEVLVTEINALRRENKRIRKNLG